ncbi:MAG TPA: TadE/TadG family type IV pilus assembly protein [Ruminiclostridium sp.]
MKKLDNKGNVAIIMCLLITALLGLTAFVIDIGMVYVEKVKLSNAIDSAALAAVLELPIDDIKAKAVAEDYLQKNNVDPNQTVIAISEDHKSIQINGVKNVKHIFAQIIGISSSNIEVKTKAVVAPVKSVEGGIRPFAVEAYDFSYGDLVALKEGAGDGYQGNYGVVSFGGTGANVFRGNALYGYSGTISVGDYIDTEPGNMAGVCNDIKNYINSENSTFENFSRDSIRLWTIPLVDSLAENGRGTVLVSGFAVFYVENVTNKSGKLEFSGRFIRYVLNSQIDENLNDTGAYGAKLSR